MVDESNGSERQVSRRLIVVDLAVLAALAGMSVLFLARALGEHAGTRRWPRTSRLSRGHAAVNDTNPPSSDHHHHVDAASTGARLPCRTCHGGR